MWRIEWDDALRANYNVSGGLSARALAAELGSTKGTVIRRARILGIATDNHHRKSRARIARSFMAKPLPQERFTYLDMESGPAPILPLVNPPRPARRAQAQPRSLPSSPVTHCPWMDGAGMMAPQCGKPTTRGTSWCQEHYQRVFQKVSCDD